MGKQQQVINPTGKHYFLEILRAVIVAVIISLTAILLLAFLIKAVNIPTEVLPIINQVVKGVSILTACLICLRLPKNGWLRGLAVGVIYVVLAYVIFSLLNGVKFEFGLNILNDAVIGTVSGLISGIIAALIRKRKA